MILYFSQFLGHLPFLHGPATFTITNSLSLSSLLQKTLSPAMLHLTANLNKSHPPAVVIWHPTQTDGPTTDGRTDRRTCTNVLNNYKTLVILPSLAVAPKLSLGKFAANLRSFSDTTPANHASALQKKRIETELEAKNTFETFT